MWELNEQKNTYKPSRSELALDKLQENGFLVKRLSEGAYEYKICEYENADDMFFCQSGTVLFVGTWDEVSGYLIGWADNL